MATPMPRTLAFSVRAPVARRDLDGLCARVCALLDGSDAAALLCDVDGVEPDAVVIDALARLALAAHRHGCEVRLVGPSPELLELVAFAGLGDVLKS